MFDFVTYFWPTALPPAASLDDRWQLAGKSPAKKRKTSGKRPARRRQPVPRTIIDGLHDGIDAVILALIAACRERGRSWGTVCVSDLADAMNCSVGESSKRVKDASADERFVWAQRLGRQKMVGLHKLTDGQWKEICASTPDTAVSLYRVFAASQRNHIKGQFLGRTGASDLRQGGIPND